MRSARAARSKCSAPGRFPSPASPRTAARIARLRGHEREADRGAHRNPPVAVRGTAAVFVERVELVEERTPFRYPLGRTVHPRLRFRGVRRPHDPLSPFGDASLDRPALPLPVVRVGGAFAVPGCIERDGRVAEMAHEPAGQAEHVGGAFVLRATVADQDRRAGALGPLGPPADARDGLPVHLHLEALLRDSLLCLFAESFHRSTPAARRRAHQRATSAAVTCAIVSAHTGVAAKNERKAPAGIAVDPQAACEVRFGARWAKRRAIKERASHASLQALAVPPS